MLPPHASDTPSPAIDSAVPAMDQRSTGRRPTRSDSRPHTGHEEELHQRVHRAEQRRDERRDAEGVARLLREERHHQPEARAGR